MPAIQKDIFNAVYTYISSRGHNAPQKHKISSNANQQAQQHHALNIQYKVEFTTNTIQVLQHSSPTLTLLNLQALKLIIRFTLQSSNVCLTVT